MTSGFGFYGETFVSSKASKASKAAKKLAAPKPFVCLECGKRFTTKAAERASFGPDGCPGCGGSDIDLYVAPEAS